MKVVLDASAGVAAVLDDPPPAILDTLARATVVVAPDLFAAEVTNSLWKYVIAGRLSIDDAVDRLEAALHLIDRYEPVSAFTQEVLREAAVRKHPSYDLCYTVLARREGASVLTMDGRLRKLVAAMKIAVHP